MNRVGVQRRLWVCVSPRGAQRKDPKLRLLSGWGSAGGESQPSAEASPFRGVSLSPPHKLRAPSLQATNNRSQALEHAQEWTGVLRGRGASSMATVIFSSPACSSRVAAVAATSHDSAAVIRRASTQAGSVSATLVSCFHGVRLAAEVKALRTQNSSIAVSRISAAAVVDTGVKPYTLPTWADFEMGRFPVYWDTDNGKPPTSGQLLTVYFNPSASELTPNSEYGIGFNGGFNQPIMCGGDHRVMTRKERGSLCEPIYAIKINMPLHALTLEFSFTDGQNWDGPYKLTMELPSKLKGLPQRYFDEGLAKELAHEGACENAIYPEAVFVQDRCAFPAGMIQQGGDRCDLDIVPGCTDPESPFFDPLANVDDGSCPYISDGEN